jgi:hypothetical protein
MRALPILALAAGCTGNSFSKDDSRGMMYQLMMSSSATLDAAQPQTSQPPPVALSIDEMLACQAGGVLRISGDLSGDIDEAGTGSYSLDLMTTFADCDIGKGMIVSGAPYLSTTGMFTFDGGVLTDGHMTYSGAFTANGDTCNVDFTLTLAAEGPRFPFADGAICGNSTQFSAH